jgi:hypothetical protein
MLMRLLAGLVLSLSALTARADVGVIDDVPAATMLIPYFEVDPDNPAGVKTIINLHNTSASAGVVRVVFWTDLGLPTAAFNLYLTGFDAETLNLRSIFNRDLPYTADDGDDLNDTGNPNDGISNQGPLSQDINFPGFGQISADALAASISPELTAAHSGGPSQEYFGGQCGSRNLGDGIARGYITIDTMTTQSRRLPDELEYQSGELDFRNIFAADYLIVDPARREVQADLAVHIEATYPGLPFVSDQTFYDRFNNTNQDRREPLPTAWLGRAAAGRTAITYWRDPAVPLAPFACGGSPAGLPTGQRVTTVFDAAGTPVSSPGGNLFPFVSGLNSGTNLGITPTLGSLFANLNLPGPLIRQSWVQFRQIPTAATAGTGPSYTVPGIQLGQAATSDDPTSPQN